MQSTTTGAAGGGGGVPAATMDGMELKQRQNSGVLKKADSGDWLAEIFDAVDDGAITSLVGISDMALPDEAIAELEAEGLCGAGGAGGAGGEESAADGRAGGKRGRSEGGGEEMAKHKKSKREKLRREALNDRFMDLSALLDPSKPPKTDKATIVTEAAQVISHLRKELATLSATLEALHKSNETLETEKSGLVADKAAMMQDKAALQQDKHKLENQLHCFMSSMPFASPPPGMAFTVPAGHFPPGAPPPPGSMVMAPSNPGAMKLAPNQPGGPGGMMPQFMWSFPPLVVQTTTAEEDAKLRAPVA